jgi:transmembrane sensor
LKHPSFAELFEKYISNTCSPEEVDQLMAMLEDDNQEPATKELLREYMLKDLNPAGYTDAVLQEQLEQRFQQITQYIKTEPAGTTDAVVITPRAGYWWRFSAAAAILLMLSAGIWYWLRPDATKPIQVSQTHSLDDIAPGSNKATLQLGDGQVISLDSAANRMLSQQGIAVVNNENGKLIYHTTTDSVTNRQSVPYNKLSTPAGGQYQLLLPDGTQVWLNAASGIQYPVAFTGNERRVTVTGEVYFEVKPLFHKRAQASSNGDNEKIPFIVQVQKSLGIVQEVQVLGTHFNINAYEDEETVKTTLLEGKVKIASSEWQVASRNSATKNSKQDVILHPGEQAVQTPHLPLTTNHSPDLNQVMAWKNGLFVFDGVDLKTVLRQLARWYDVEITFEKGAPVSELFNGTMQRNLSLNQIIIGLNGMGVHVKKEGKKLLVTP